MKTVRMASAFYEWLPIPVLFIFLGLVTNGFTRFPSWNVAALFLTLFAGNLAWIVVMRGARRVGEFKKDYPGFRAQRDG